MRTEARSSCFALPRALSGFENIRRYRNAAGQIVVKLLPGDYYVTCEDEILDTVLGSCISACIRSARLRIGGMNHFMLPKPGSESGDNWNDVAGRATRYGTASMEQLINRILAAGTSRADLEIKIFGGGRVLASMTDVGRHNISFVRDFLKQEGLSIAAEDVGEMSPRHVQYFPLTGRVRVRHLNRAQEVVAHEQQYMRGLEKAPVAGSIDLF